ncbi:hypothetical protein [Pseudonocardia humida]|uniref:CHAD domain-containing protein n=1 Tax=Pseudonocardia humida TaxID=2800819 RepID=A0ABT1A3E6_9PSEU|nr:hypothetical protein [Pseudonocardia humida]MCO1657486.1 hypothetical protein [Pseudonocardia humida]
MIDDRRSATWLDAELTRREDAESRMSAALLDLERHPGHVLLSDGTPTGTTGRRWAVAREALSGLWRDFAAYRSIVRAARAVRERRGRPGERELAELHRLLVEPSVEIARTAVALPERGLTGAPERVEVIALDGLAERMERAFAEVSRLAVEADAAHTAFLGELVPVLERLTEARRRAAALGIGPGDAETTTLADLDDRAAALHRLAATDPLARDAGTPAVELAALATGTRELADRLDRLVAQRDRWDADVHAARRALAELGRLRAEAEDALARAAELVAGPLPELPADERAALRAALDRVERASGWPVRAAGLTGLQVALAAAADGLRTAHRLAAGLLERRDELRGRFSAFAARAARLGRAEDPEVLELDERLRRLLWTTPCDLVAATQALAAYRRHLAPAAGQPGMSRTASEEVDAP